VVFCSEKVRVSRLFYKSINPYCMMSGLNFTRYILTVGVLIGIIECLMLSVPFWMGYSVSQDWTLIVCVSIRVCLLFFVFWYYKERICQGIFRFKTGTLLTLFIFIISTIMYLAYFNYFVEHISTDYLTILRAQEYERLVSEGASQARIGYIYTFTTPMMLSVYAAVTMLISYFAIGLIFSYLLYTKKSSLDVLD
jgi:hypothetical protein